MTEVARYEVLWITEDEMYDLMHDPDKLKGTASGMPGWCSVNRAGYVQFWPPFDPEKHTIMMTKRWGK